MKNFKNRYVITGCGVICSAGNDVKSFQSALKEDRQYFSTVKNKISDSFAAGFISDDVLKVDKKKTRRQQLAESSLREALKQANLANKPSSDLILISPHNTDDRLLNETYMQKMGSDDYYSKRFLPDTGGYALAGYLSNFLNHSGISFSLSAGCASSNLAIYQCISQMEISETEIGVVSSATISPRSEYDIWTYQSLGLLNDYSFSQQESFFGPLDHERSGLMLTEAGASIIIESLDHALKENKEILAEIIGYGHFNCNSSSFSSSSESIEKAIEKTIQSAALQASDINLVSLNTTGSFDGDHNEIKTMKNIFKNSKAKFNTIKGHIGDGQEISGLLEIIGNLESFQSSEIHPCSGIRKLDPELSLKGLVVGESVYDDQLEYFLNFNNSVYGLNNGLLLKKWK